MLASRHPLFRRYTFIRYAVRHCDEPRFVWARNLECKFDNFWEFADEIVNSIGLPPTASHRLSRLDQSQGWIPGNFCWRTGSELVGNNSRAVHIPVRARGRKTLKIQEIARLFGITYHQAYRRIHKKNYSFRDFRKEFGHA